MTLKRHMMLIMSTQTHERIPPLTLGWRLKMALGDGNTQEMADYLEVSRQTVSRWMSDKGAPPRRPFVVQWALKTGVDLNWLETGKTPTVDGGGSDGQPAGYHGRVVSFPGSMGTVAAAA